MKKFYVLIDGYAYKGDGKNPKPLTEKDHEKLTKALIQAAEQQGYSFGFGSILLSKVQVAAREQKMSKIEWDTGEKKKKKEE